jgi:hypothetical protein
MTTTEALKAGRELDALVAERVMGWRPYPTPAYDGYRWPEWWEDPQTGNRRLGWHPSTDIAAAWTVLERLQVLTRERNLWGPSLQVRAPISGQRWVVRVANDLYGGMAEPHTDDTIWQGVADTFPEAVCLCALQAVALST